MKRSIPLAMMLVGSLAVLACSSTGGAGSTGTSSVGAGGSSSSSTSTTATTSSSTTTSGSTSSSTGGTGGASGTGGGSGTGGAMGPKPAPPTIQMVMKMMGALHVMWDNATPDCDKIHMLRNHDKGAYAVAYTLAGSATEKHDAAAIPPGTYCYKLQCEKGGVTSDDSNIKCNTP